ncbi:hypothetical protein M153_6220004644 [Pseudoloma neurophilia]|uniref:Uncharacterized protein n=1 Tax=Pseudoloma neurophilia TaxID=146866 RepID=A0A0R0M4F2_9MICR|nr:hypothetical protein M153_6220004644 [Pseudoloma neurophilia]
MGTSVMFRILQLINFIFRMSLQSSDKNRKLMVLFIIYIDLNFFIYETNMNFTIKFENILEISKQEKRIKEAKPHNN